MGNTAGRNKTHPVSEDDPDYTYHDYGYDYEYDQRIDYDSNWHPEKNYGDPYFYEHDISPMVKKRSCTDVICFLLFLVFLGGWGAVAFLGIRGGDISKVIYPTDSQGNICGKGEMVDRTALLMFDLTQCLNPAILVTGCLTNHVCVEECPKETYSPIGALKLGIESESTIKRKMKPYCRLVNEEVFRKDVKTLIDQEICPPWYLKSTEILGRCFPASMEPAVNNTNKEVIVRQVDTGGDHAINRTEIERSLYRFSSFLNVRQFGERVFSDLRETYWMIGLALIGACVLSFIWIVLMRFLASFMVWVSILAVFLGVGGLLGYCSYRLYFIWLSTDPETHKNIFQLNWTPEIVEDFLNQRDTWLAFTIILGIIFLVIVLLFIFLRQRILIAIALIEQGSKAVGQMFSSLFFPIIPFLLQLVVVGWFLVVAMYLSSWGEQEYRVSFKNNRDCSRIDACARTVNESFPIPYQANDTCIPQEFEPCKQECPEAHCNFVKYTKNKDYSWMQFINVFGLYWGVFFFSAFGEIVLAGVFSQWYWTYNKKTDLPDCSLGTAMWNATVFHLGTVAFGSLLIAIIRMIRTMLEYIERKCKRFNNDLTRCLIWTCKCCLWCLEKFMRFINRNAYIMCAVKNTNFCTSAKDAFNLLMRNLVRVVVLDSVVDFLLFLGKLVIVLLTGIASYMTFSGQIPDIEDKIPTLNYIFTPVVFIVVGSYFIASSFFGVYNMAVDTLFLCFLEDLERNDGSIEKPYYMSKSLKQILGKMEKTVNESRYRSPR